MFKTIGIPADYNGRDNSLLYTLVDNSPSSDTDLNYQLRFADGITHSFNAGTGMLASVGDVTSGLSTYVNIILGFGVVNPLAKDAAVAAEGHKYWEVRPYDKNR